MACDLCWLWWLWLLLLWTNPLYYLEYWVSLGRFYLLNIHCDCFLISPLCGVAETPDCGMLLLIYSISPLCGVAQTPDWGMIYLIILSRRRFRHPIGAFYFYSIIAYSCCIWITCLCASWILFCDWRCDHEIFQSMSIFHIIIPVFIMFASTFKVLTGLSLAIVLARFLAWRGALRRQPRNLRQWW